MLLALPIGMLIGLSLGALGGGGSILTVPALVYLLGESPHSATTASLIIVGVTSIVGMAVHLRAGRVRLRSGIVFGVLGAGGAFAGSRLSASVDPNALLAAFSVLLAGAAVTMLYRQRTRSALAPEPAAAGRLRPTRLATPAAMTTTMTTASAPVAVSRCATRRREPLPRRELPRPCRRSAW